MTANLMNFCTKNHLKICYSCGSLHEEHFSNTSQGFKKGRNSDPLASYPFLFLSSLINSTLKYLALVCFSSHVFLCSCFQPAQQTHLCSRETYSRDLSSGCRGVNHTSNAIDTVQHYSCYLLITVYFQTTGTAQHVVTNLKMLLLFLK